jgi:hypothetical protein
MRSLDTRLYREFLHAFQWPIARGRISKSVIARSEATKQSSKPCRCTGLLRGACHRAGHFGPDPLARNDEARAISFSQRVFCSRPSLAKPLHESCPEKIRGAERREARSQEPHHASRRYRLNTLRARRAPRNCDVTAAMRFGRARLSALRRGTRQALRLAQLRAALPGNLQQLALLQTPLLASSSRPGRNAGEAGSEAARERFAKPHAGTALAPSNGTPPVDAPDERAPLF